MDRRHFLLMGIQLLTTGVVAAQAGRLAAAEPISYDRLMSTLYPKTEGEKKDLKEITALVRARKLPEKLVYAAWRSAESKQKNRRVRIFAETLAILCKRSDVPLKVKLTL